MWDISKARNSWSSPTPSHKMNKEVLTCSHGSCKVFLERRWVHCSRHEDDFEICPLIEHPAQQCQQEVGMQIPLVHFVNDDVCGTCRTFSSVQLQQTQKALDSASSGHYARTTGKIFVATWQKKASAIAEERVLGLAHVNLTSTYPAYPHLLHANSPSLHDRSRRQMPIR